MKLWGTLIAFFICLHQHYGNSAEIEENAAQQSDSPMVRSTRGGLNMLRLGRAGKYRTRGVRMLRLGKRADPLENLTYDDLKDILSSLYDTEKHPMVRQPPLPRYGRELDLLDDYDPMAKRMSPDAALQLLEAEAYGSHMRPAPRLGRFKRSPDSSENEIASDVIEDGSDTVRALPIPRFGRLVEGKGKSADDEKDGDERAVPMPRIGRAKVQENGLESDKRGLAMLRLGRSMKMLRLGKREPVAFEEPEEKRSLALLRLGKRRMRMLRLGKREPGSEEGAEKRSLKLLRLGKREDADHQIDTRALSMLRLGRSQTDDKRSLKLLRLG